MVSFAVTLSNLIEKGGAYAGIAAFFGLAVLAVLFFAQARELKRLREWAGRAPERAQELEQRVVEQAEAARRVRAEPQAQPARLPGRPLTAAAQRAAAPASAGFPASVAAPASAASPAIAPASAPAATPATQAPAGAPAEEGSPTEHPVVASAPTPAVPAEARRADDAAQGAEAPAREAVTAGAAGAAAAPPAASPGTTALPAVAGNGAPPAGEIPPIPARATPAQAAYRLPPPHRSAPAPVPLPADTGVARRPSAPRPGAPQLQAPEPKERRIGLIVGGVFAGVAVVVVAISAILGGSDTKPAGHGKTTTSRTSSPAATVTSEAKAPKVPSSPTRAETTVGVLNGTTIAGLAAGVNTKLQQAGFAKGPDPTDYSDQARSATVVFYASRPFEAQAKAAAKLLGVSDVQLIVDAARGLAPGADVVVVVGADQTP